jgi:hypothetical protein
VIGKTISSYKVTSELGKGGMGEVWRAQGAKLGRAWPSRSSGPPSRRGPT